MPNTYIRRMPDADIRVYLLCARWSWSVWWGDGRISKCQSSSGYNDPEAAKTAATNRYTNDFIPKHTGECPDWEVLK